MPGSMMSRITRSAGESLQAAGSTSRPDVSRSTRVAGPGEVVRDQFGDVEVVLDDENPGHAWFG